LRLGEGARGRTVIGFLVLAIIGVVVMGTMVLILGPHAPLGSPMCHWADLLLG
jgi:hypothetical protein